MLSGNISIMFYVANDAKERQKWIDKLRVCSGANAADAVSIPFFVLIFLINRFLVKFVSSLPSPKSSLLNTSSSSNETQSRSTNRRDSKYNINKV